MTAKKAREKAGLAAMIALGVVMVLSAIGLGHCGFWAIVHGIIKASLLVSSGTALTTYAICRAEEG